MIDSLSRWIHLDFLETASGTTREGNLVGRRGRGECAKMTKPYHYLYNEGSLVYRWRRSMYGDTDYSCSTLCDLSYLWEMEIGGKTKTFRTIRTLKGKVKWDTSLSVELDKHTAYKDSQPNSGHWDRWFLGYLQYFGVLNEEKTQKFWSLSRDHKELSQK